MQKRGVELSLNVVIIAAIALVVLIVLLSLVFTGVIKVNTETKCTGQCVDSCSVGAQLKSGVCSEGKVCCVSADAGS